MGQGIEDTLKEKRSSLLAFIRRRINDAEEAEDILQEVFLKASENFDTLAPLHDLGAWLWKVARNKIIDYYRHREVRQKHEMPAVPPQTNRNQTTPQNSNPSKTHPDNNELGIDQILPDQDIGIEEAYLRKEITDALFESLDELPQEQRDVFLLQAVEGYTFAQIAELTGTSINTLTARKRYAVAFLKKRLSEIKDVLDDIQK